MTEQLAPDLCVIGAGAAGLSVAAAAATLGAPVVLIESGLMGGECLNTGCVPSKAMIAAAKRAEAFRTSGPFGIKPAKPVIEFAEVNDHIHSVIKAIAPNDSKERFAGLGVRVIEGEARFRDPNIVVVGSYQIAARRFVIATGSRPDIPQIVGLEKVPYLTNENAFELREQPKHLIVIGAGPVGLELAQAFRRLGSEVTVLDAGQPLGKEDPECAAIVLDTLAREGITVRSGVKIERVRRLRQGIEIALAGATEEVIQGTNLLLATGRRPNIDALDLTAARVKHERHGITINNRFRTSNRQVYAIGDVTSLPAFTHSAGHQASLLVRHLLFRLPVNIKIEDIPRVTFTDPELAHVGLTDLQARDRHGSIRVLRWPYRDNDRAQTEREIRGHIKIVTNTKGLILGATIVGAAAGEQITAWTLAISQGLNIRAFAEIVVPYPTYTEIGKRAGITFFTPRLTTNWVRRILNLLRRFG
jgi:pyruvate/2-oxoglutarate dehydrogenase complex dihydrolipoamide dehydrogenase (E3) component